MTLAAPKILGPDGRPFVKMNGNGKGGGYVKGRGEVVRFLNDRSGRKARASYDAARDSEEYRRHWANTDALDPDSANNKVVRDKLKNRSRYEGGSNGYYKGILRTHANMVWGTGPKLRMLTKNKPFNQLIERDFYAWSNAVALAQKGWAMTFARYADGETFCVLQNNPLLDGVQLDLLPIEAEQCQTPYLPYLAVGYIDGIRFDEWNNILWYDVLESHPGANSVFGAEPTRIDPANMLHWFKLERPGTHRGVPDLTPTLNLGASSRRVREATVAKAETEADFTLVLKSLYETQEEDRYESQPMDAFEIEKRMAVTLPNSLDPVQLKSTTPGPEYSAFNRSMISEQAAPISQPYNVAAKDSSTYSFASGKMDVLCYRSEIDVERGDAGRLMMDKIFKSYFGEWSLLNRGVQIPPSDMGPLHQWDWPAHPVIDDNAESNATDTRLKNGTETLRESFSKQGRDYEDELQVMAEDWFGEATEETVDKARKINLLRNVPQHAMEAVAALIGVKLPQAQGATNVKAKSPTNGQPNGQTNGAVSR